MIKDKRIKIAAGLLRLVVTILLMALLAFSSYVLYVQKTYGTEQLSKIPVAFLVVTSGSMEPKISAGDGICVYEEDYQNLSVGDIITFEVSGELITHQIVRFEYGRPITKGLANEMEDSPVMPEQYRAKTILIVPGLARVLAWSDSAFERSLVIMLLFLLLFGWDMMSWIYDKAVGKEKQL